MLLREHSSFIEHKKCLYAVVLMDLTRGHGSSVQNVSHGCLWLEGVSSTEFVLLYISVQRFRDCLISDYDS